jgi:hypothetical protein
VDEIITDFIHSALLHCHKSIEAVKSQPQFSLSPKSICFQASGDEWFSFPVYKIIFRHKIEQVIPVIETKQMINIFRASNKRLYEDSF